VKDFLEGQGYIVKGEIGTCDLVAQRHGEEPVIVELKRMFSLELLLQGVDRLKLSNLVYLAVPAPHTSARSLLRRRHRDILRLCRLLGLGLLSVHLNGRPRAWVEPVLDPGPYNPRKNKFRREHLLKEFAQRQGDPNRGGSTRRKIVTAYRQAALRCAMFLEVQGPRSLAEIREQCRVPNAGPIMQANHYGWFQRVRRGIYKLTPSGKRALATYADVIAELHDQ
jgi:hypothetical protein